MPVGVVDLDRSPASRSLISELDAASTSKIVFVVHDEAEGLDAFKRMKADTLITIAHNYAEELARGRNVTVNVLGNGAYPVKTRAVQATIARIVGDTEERMNHASWMTAGGSPELLAAASRQAPDIIVKYRFNEISGYGNYTVPMVGPLIIQAVLFFGVGLSFGGWLNEKPRQRFIRDAVRNPFYGAVAVFLAFWSVARGWFLYMQGFDFSFGEYGAMQNPFAVFLVAFCFTAAVTAFAMAAATLTGNGWTAPAVVIMSAPVFFISGAVWPLGNLNPLVPGFAQQAGEPWNRDLMEVLKTFEKTGKPMIGHCAAGMMFGFAGVAAGRRVAVHPTAKAAVTGPVATDAPFEIDGNFFTAQEEHAIPAMIGRVVEALK